MKKRVSYLIILFLLASFALYLYWGNRSIQVAQHHLRVPNLPPSTREIKLAQVSDLHNFDWRPSLIGILEREKPDYILLTGDSIDSYEPNPESTFEFIQQCQQFSKVVYVSGNHEARLDDYGEILAKLRTMGVIVLEDEYINLPESRGTVQLLGVNDPFFYPGESRFDFRERIERAKISAHHLDRDDRQKHFVRDPYRILMSHRPEHIEVYLEAGINLTLSGHAHGGQIRLPFIGPIFAPNQGFFPSYTAGFYERDGKKMYVSRGLGASRIPWRILNRPELIFFHLQGEKEE